MFCRTGSMFNDEIIDKMTLSQNMLNEMPINRSNVENTP